MIHKYYELTLIIRSWKKSKTQDHHRARFPGKNSAKSIAIIGIYLYVLDFFGESPKNWHISLLGHMPTYIFSEIALGDGHKNHR